MNLNNANVRLDGNLGPLIGGLRPENFQFSLSVRGSGISIPISHEWVTFQPLNPPGPVAAAGVCPCPCPNCNVGPFPFSPPESDNISLVSFEESPPASPLGYRQDEENEGGMAVDEELVIEQKLTDTEDEEGWIKDLENEVLLNVNRDVTTKDFQSIFISPSGEVSLGSSRSLPQTDVNIVNETPSRDNDRRRRRSARFREGFQNVQNGQSRRRGRYAYAKGSRPTSRPRKIDFNQSVHGNGILQEACQEEELLVSKTVNEEAVVSNPNDVADGDVDIEPTPPSKRKTPKKKNIGQKVTDPNQLKEAEVVAEPKRAPKRQPVENSILMFPGTPEKDVKLAKIQKRNLQDWRKVPKEVREIRKAGSNHTGNNRYYVEEIVDVKYRNKDQKLSRHFFIKWWGWIKEYNSWEEESYIDSCAEDGNKTPEDPLPVFLRKASKADHAKVKCGLVDFQDDWRDGPKSVIEFKKRVPMKT